ncbi:MAG: MMPL family transporter, partial [Planctomycetota bacterium]
MTAERGDSHQGSGPAFYRALRRHRMGALVTCALLLALLVWSARGLSWREDVLELLPDSDPVVQRYRTLLELFRPTEFLYLDVGPSSLEEPVPVADLLQVADRLAALLEDALHSDTPLIARLVYRRGPEQVMEALDFLVAHRASLFSEEDRERLVGSLEPAAIRETLSGWKKLLTESPAPFLASVLAADPLHFNQGLSRQLSGLQEGGAVTVHEGRLFSADLQHVLLIARPRHKSTDSAHARELLAFLDQALPEAEREAPGGNVKIAYLAGHRFSVENADLIQSDLRRVLTFSFLGIALLAFLAFRRPLFALLVLLPAAFGAAFAVGLARWLVPEISAISIGCGSMLVGVSVDYGVHLLFHNDRNPRAGPGAVLSRLIRPLLLGAATTVAAFLGLQASVMPGFRQLGWVAVFGIAGAAGFAILILPLLLPETGPRKEPRPPLLLLTEFVPAWFRLARSARPALLLSLLVLTGAGMAGLLRTGFDGDYRNLNGASAETQRDLGTLLHSFGETLDSTSIAVSAGSEEEALQENERVRAELEQLRREGMIAGYRSLALLLPSAALQQRNRERWEGLWTKERIETLRRDLASAGQELRMRAEAFEPLLQSLPGEMPPLHPADFRPGILSDLLETHLARAAGRHLLLTGVRRAPDGTFERVVERLEAVAPDLLVADGQSFMAHLVQVIYSEMATVGWVGLALILVPLLIGLRRPSRIAPVLLPPLVSLVWT